MPQERNMEMIKKIFKLYTLKKMCCYLYKLLARRNCASDNIFKTVETDVKTNKKKFKKYIYRNEAAEKRFTTFKKKNPNLVKTISHTRSLNLDNNLEEFLGNDELWDILIDWKHLLGENIYLQRHKNKNG